MTDVSSYLAHLPPVLWQGSPGDLDLGAVLRIFEKVATGIDDDAVLTHASPPGGGPAHTHRALTDEIAGLHRLFDPWMTPVEFLPWLASWVALTFPTLQGEPLWDEYQRRKVTAGIAQVYRVRGRRAGLNQYLELYAVGTTSPRICVDDGARLVAVTPQPGSSARVEGLVTQGPVVGGGQVRREGLARPWCIATDSGGSLLVGDIGVPSIQLGPAVPLPGRLWRLDPAGRYPLAGTPSRPRPLVPSTAIDDVAAVAVRPARGQAPETVYALTRTGRLLAVPAPFAAAQATVVTTLGNAGTPVWMVGLTVDPDTGDLIALDRGGHKPQPARPSVVTVRPFPLAVTRTPLTTVAEPLTLTADPHGILLVGDGGPQEPDPEVPAQLVGNLVRVERGPSPWTETALLPLDPRRNPLVAPTGLARLGDTLYVLDVGLKPFEPSAELPFVCPVAEHAGVYEYRDDPTPGLARITPPGQFVYPTGLCSSGDRLLVVDPGTPAADLQPYLSRVLPFQFDVTVHFTAARVPADPDQRKQALKQAVGAISTIVADQKPAHTTWTLTTSTST